MARRPSVKKPTKAQLQKMREAGMGMTAIGKALDLTHSTVKYYLKKYGLSTAPYVRYHDDAAIDREIERWRAQQKSSSHWSRQ